MGKSLVKVTTTDGSKMVNFETFLLPMEIYGLVKSKEESLEIAKMLIIQPKMSSKAKALAGKINGDTIAERIVSCIEVLEGNASTFDILDSLICMGNKPGSIHSILSNLVRDGVVLRKRDTEKGSVYRLAS